MKKFLSLLLISIILFSPFNLGLARVEAKVVKKSPAQRVRPKSLSGVRMSVAACETDDYVPGRLIITYSKNPQYEFLSRTADKRLLQKMKNEDASYLLTNQAKQFGIKKIRPLHNSDYDSLDKFKTRLQGLSNNSNDEIEKQKLMRKLKYESLMQETSISRSYVLDTEITNCKNLQKLIDKLMKDNSVEKINVDHILHTSSLVDGNPNDTYFQGPGTANPFPHNYDAMWNIKKIQAPQSWKDSTGKGVVVAVLDTGVDYNHPDLFDNIWVDPNLVSDRDNNGVIDIKDLDVNSNRQIDANEFIDDALGHDYGSDDTNSINDDVASGDNLSYALGHGTHVAGTIAALGNNNLGVVGVAPEAKIMSVKVFGDSGSEVAISDGITYAVNHDADLINMSLAFIIPLKDKYYDCESSGYLYEVDNRTGFTEYFDCNNPSIKLGEFQDLAADSFYSDGIAIKSAIASGMKFVIGAGNDDINVYDGGIAVDDRNREDPVTKISLYPLIAGVIGVGASTEVDTRASEFSNYGAPEYIDIAAPGGGSTKFRKTINYTKKIDFSTGLYGACSQNLSQNFLISSDNILSTVPSSNYQTRGHVYLPSSGSEKVFLYNEASIIPAETTVSNNVDYLYTCSSDSLTNSKVGAEEVHGYEVYKGTSMATPHVSGAAALLLSIKPDLSPAQVRDILVSTGDAIKTDQPIGPRLNVRKAVDELKKRITPPAAPNLISATHNFTTKILSASWSTVTADSNAGAIKYNYKISQISSTSSSELDVANGSISSTSTSLSTAALALRVYRFKVQACNDYACSNFSNAIDFVINQSPPALVTGIKINNANVIDGSVIDTAIAPSFSWSAAARATGYDLLVTNLTTNNSVANLSKAGITTTTYSPNLILPVGNYSLKITPYAGTSLSGSGLPTTVKFTVLAKPAAFTISTPAGLNTARPSFAWAASVGASNYDVVIKNKTTNAVAYSSTSTTTNFIVGSDLADATYTLTVTAKNGAGNTAVSKDFTILTPPLAVTGIKVNNNLANGYTLDAALKPSFSWNASAKATGYNLVLTNLATNSSVTNISKTGIVGTTYAPNVSLVPGSYSLTITPYSSLVGSSTTVIFSILAKPGAFTLNTPTGLTTPRPSFSWTASDSASSYSVVVKNKATNAIAYSNTSTTATNLTMSSNLADASYTITVTAQNAVGTLPISQDFTILTPLPSSNNTSCGPDGYYHVSSAEKANASFARSYGNGPAKVDFTKCGRVMVDEGGHSLTNTWTFIDPPNSGDVIFFVKRRRTSAPIGIRYWFHPTKVTGIPRLYDIYDWNADVLIKCAYSATSHSYACTLTKTIM